MGSAWVSHLEITPGEAASHWKGFQLSPLFLSRTDGCGLLSSAHGDANRPVLHWQKHLHSTLVGPRLSGPSNWARTHDRQVRGGMQGRHGSSGSTAKLRDTNVNKNMHTCVFFVCWAGIGKECIFFDILKYLKDLYKAWNMMIIDDQRTFSSVSHALPNDGQVVPGNALVVDKAMPFTQLSSWTGVSECFRWAVAWLYNIVYGIFLNYFYIYCYSSSSSSYLLCTHWRFYHVLSLTCDDRLGSLPAPSQVTLGTPSSLVSSVPSWTAPCSTACRWSTRRACCRGRSSGSNAATSLKRWWNGSPTAWTWSWCSSMLGRCRWGHRWLLEQGSWTW